MKLVLDKLDKLFEDRVNNGDYPLGRLCFTKTDKEYSLNFKVIDIAKANNFIFTLSNMTGDPSEETKDLIEATGIDITSLNFFSATSDFDKAELKRRLQEIVDSL